MKINRRQKEEKKEQKLVEIRLDEPNETYHSAQTDPFTGTPYYSSSTIKSIINGVLFSPNSAALDFGSTVHSIAESYLKGEHFVYGMANQLKVKMLDPDNEGAAQFRVSYNADVATLDAMVPKIKEYIDKNITGKFKTLMIEPSIYISGDEWKTQRVLDFPVAYRPLVHFFKCNLMPVKARADVLMFGDGVASQDGILLDWKTTKEPSPGLMRKACWGYNYPFSAALYAVAAQVAYGAIVNKIKFVFLPKTKGAASPLVEVVIDSARDKKELSKYLKDFLPSTAGWVDLEKVIKEYKSSPVHSCGLFN